MKFDRNFRAFLKKFPLRRMNGHQQFLVISAFYCHGRNNVPINISIIKKNWKKSILSTKYNPVFYGRAQSEGWVNPKEKTKGVFFVEKEGLDYLSSLVLDKIDIKMKELRKSGGLIIVNEGGAHTFDKFLRKIIVESKTHVMIADSWVDDTIFDNILDVISKERTLKLIYNNKLGNFSQRAKRFSIQYRKFAFKKYNFLHDRFIIADNTGYVLGPSIKDAAVNKPALVVILSREETKLLMNFFQELWKKAN